MEGATKRESKKEEAAQGLYDHRTGDAEKSEVEDVLKGVLGHCRLKI